MSLTPTRLRSGTDEMQVMPPFDLIEENASLAGGNLAYRRMAPAAVSPVSASLGAAYASRASRSPWLLCNRVPFQVDEIHTESFNEVTLSMFAHRCCHLATPLRQVAGLQQSQRTTNVTTLLRATCHFANFMIATLSDHPFPAARD